MAKPIGQDPSGQEPLEGEPRDQNTAAFDDRRSAFIPESVKKLPQWATIAIGVGTMAVLAVLAYVFLK